MIDTAYALLSREVQVAIEKARPAWERIDAIRLVNQKRVLDAFRRHRVAEHHLAGTTGYGYNDPARETLGAVFAASLQAEAALVQPQLISGTHAITCALFGVLRPGDHLLSITGPPYDTLQQVIHGPSPGALIRWGIEYDVVHLTPEGHIDLPGVLAALRPNTRMVMIQRSRGYSLRPSVPVEAIGRAAEAVHRVRPDICVFVDNCYGEFVETLEPTAVGADLMAGSLIKNPGGTLAPSGGYIAGRPDLVARAAEALTAPGLGGKVGPTLGLGRTLLQGLFMAPHIVGEALMGVSVAAALFDAMGYEVSPGIDEHRTDSVQVIVLERPERVLAFCRAIQGASPVDATAAPEPGELPGYDDPVVMAAGTFVQGGSMELTADAPLRPPYAVFLQGGTSKEHILLALDEVVRVLKSI